MSNLIWNQEWGGSAESGGIILPPAPTGPGGVVNVPFKMAHLTSLAITGVGAPLGTAAAGIIQEYTIPLTMLNDRVITFELMYNTDITASTNSLMIAVVKVDATRQELYSIYPAATTAHVTARAIAKCQNNQLTAVTNSNVANPYYMSTTQPTLSVSLSGLTDVRILILNRFAEGVSGTLLMSSVEVS